MIGIDDEGSTGDYCVGPEEEVERGLDGEQRGRGGGKKGVNVSCVDSFEYVLVFRNRTQRT